MKKGYKKLFLLEIFLFLLLALNCFIPNILSSYKIILLFLVLLVLFKFLFGFEKDKHRFTKDVIFDIIVILIISFMLYYLVGIFIGFVRTDNYYTLNGISEFIVPIIIGTILKEILRYNFLMKAEGSKILITLTILLFILFDLANSVNIRSFISFYHVFLIVSINILPAISNNLLCSYLSFKTGYKPGILFLLVIRLYSLLLPIVPNVNQYIYSLICLIYPLILLYKIASDFDKVEDEFVLSNHNKKNSFLLCVSLFFLGIVVYFMSGYFKYYAIVIGSGSMSPSINKGDLVIVEKNKKLKEGQVIAYDNEGVIVVHRLANILITNNETFYYTKGDANDNIDNLVLTEDKIIGVVNVAIPYIGLPAVWIKDL